MIGLTASFPMLSGDFWVEVAIGLGHYFLFFFPFQAFSDIYFPFPIDVSYRHVN